MVKCVTDEYIYKSTPGSGKVTREHGYNDKSHSNEISVANWLLATFGGNIVLLTETAEKNIKTPDIVWAGKYWEIKNIFSTTYTTIDKRIHKACSQIRGKNAGIIVDIRNNTHNIQKIISFILESTQKRTQTNIDLIIIYSTRYKVFRINRK